MRPSLALQTHRDEAREAARRHRTTNLRVFGPALNGTDHEDSVLDLLVDPLPGATLFNLGGLQAELEDLLGVRVGLVTLQELPERVRSLVLSQTSGV